MPSKGRWTFNPRKWFGTLSSVASKSENKGYTNNKTPQKPSTITTTATTISMGVPLPASQKPPPVPSIPSILTTRKKAKTKPSNTLNDSSGSSVSSPFTNLQLPAFNAQRAKSATVSTTVATRTSYQTAPVVPMRTEPSIRKIPPTTALLTIDATRLNTEVIVRETPKITASTSWQSSQRNFSQSSTAQMISDLNTSILSNECIIDYPQTLSHDSIVKCRSFTGTNSSSSCTDDNDAHDGSTSSGVFTDERADAQDNPRTASKDTLSTLDVHSVESIDDYPSILNRSRSQSFVQSYRLPKSTFETNETKSSHFQSQKSIQRVNRPKSAEGILKDTQTYTPAVARNRQSSAAIVKKIEKRCITNRSPTATLEKAGIVRIANDTYRLTKDREDHLYRRQRQGSVIQCSVDDDSLRPAKDEEAYATIPRTSSTEQLNDNIQDDLRAIIDDCLRPIAATANKQSDKSKKYNSRSKRPQMNNERVQINIDKMIDRLVASVDCSAYAQFQRC